MKMLRVMMAAGVLLAASGVQAQMSGMAMPATPAPAPSTGPASEVLGTYTRLKPNVIKAAEKMPAADYQFAPTPEIRTYARVVNHITEAQFNTCSRLNGTTFDKAKVPSDTADKATIVAGLKASFDECDKAYAALTDANVTEMLAAGPTNKRSRIGFAWGNVSHDNEQYAELSTYLRLKGLVPPTSEK
jgi:hypothetical protein